MNRSRYRSFVLTAVMAMLMNIAVTGTGCGDSAILFLNPSFINQTSGGLFPLVPQPESGLLLVRAVNATDQPVSFIVTVETGETEDPVTNELFTSPGSQANEAGVLFECTDDFPITRVGLGENLNQPTTNPGLFVGGLAADEQGFGVPPNINPLSLIAGDYLCGDTIIFQAIVSTNAPGGFKVQAFVLPADFQPGDTARNTFQIAGDFLRDRPGEE